jgi:hypothetical protein
MRHNAPLLGAQQPLSRGKALPRAARARVSLTGQPAEPAVLVMAGSPGTILIGNSLARISVGARAERFPASDLNRSGRTMAFYAVDKIDAKRDEGRRCRRRDLSSRKVEDSAR